MMNLLRFLMLAGIVMFCAPAAFAQANTEKLNVVLNRAHDSEKDQGAANEHFSEYTALQKIVGNLAPRLESEKADVTYYNKEGKFISLKDRAAGISELSPDALFSFHLREGADDSDKIVLYYYKRDYSSESLKMANAFKAAANRVKGRPQVEIKTTNSLLLRAAQCPALSVHMSDINDMDSLQKMMGTIGSDVLTSGVSAAIESQMK